MIKVEERKFSKDALLFNHDTLVGTLLRINSKQSIVIDSYMDWNEDILHITCYDFDDKKVVEINNSMINELLIIENHPKLDRYHNVLKNLQYLDREIQMYEMSKYNSFADEEAITAADNGIKFCKDRKHSEIVRLLGEE